MINMGNWKTTIAGIIGAIGVYLQTQTGWLQIVGQVLSGIGMLLLGHSAADKK